MSTPSSRRLRGRRDKTKDSTIQPYHEFDSNDELAQPDKWSGLSPRLRKVRSQLELLFWAWYKFLTLLLFTAYVVVVIVHLMEGRPFDNSVLSPLTSLVSGST